MTTKVSSPEKPSPVSADSKAQTFLSYSDLCEIFKKSIRKAIPDQNISAIKKDFEKVVSNSNTVLETKSSLDQAFREVLIFELSEDVEAVKKCITLSISAVREELAAVTIPVVLLGDVFEAVTLDKCEKIFKVVEELVKTWKEEIFFTACKNNILRICNDLLRRLSRAQNTVFCGRILLFLAKFFPFSERSGLNVISEFNFDNLTEYEVDGIHSDELLNDTVEDIPVKIDYNLYTKFWSLQDYFRFPNQCYNADKWKTFSNHAVTLLGAFSSFKLEEPRLGISRKIEDDEEPLDIQTNEDNINESFFAKFLTNPKLLALQLSDSNFRRTVLLQFLILFQYLQSTVKFKTDAYTLNQSQQEFVKETESNVYKLIEETPPHGKEFAKTVRHMLRREEMWNNWKNEGCKEFKKPDTSEEVEKPLLKRKKPLGDGLREANKQGKFYMGTDSLTKLWNLCPDNLNACKSEDRNFLPSLDSYFDIPKEKNDPAYEWRALRLLARQSPHFFNLTNGTTFKVSDYIENVKKKLQKEKAESKIDLNASAINNIKEENVEAIEGATELSELMQTENEADDPIITKDDVNTHKTSTATKENIEDISKKIGSDWKKLAKKLGYKLDEIEFFESESANIRSPCQAMLSNWFDDDDDASLDNLAYILEGLELVSASEFIKAIIEPIVAIIKVED